MRFFKRIKNTDMIPGKIHNNQNGGVAVVLVIWVMILLVALVGEFSYSMRTEIKIARNFKEEEEAYQLALAGVEQAKMELLEINDLRMIYRDENGKLVFKSKEDEGYQEEAEPEEGEYNKGRGGSLGKGEFTYVIEDEDGKLNLNTATNAQLRKLFLDSGVVVEDIDTIVDSILDWRDTNDLHRLNGAEEDYYRSLEIPYSSKDGSFSTVEELLLVKGITPEIFYGTRIQREKQGEELEVDSEEEEMFTGVEKYLTVSGSNVVNINTAQENVLNVMFSPQVAENILIQRANGPILRPVGKSKVDSQYFTIISTGKNSDGSITRSVRVTVRRQLGDLVTLFWDDNYVE